MLWQSALAFGLGAATISPGGLFTAPSTVGVIRVIARTGTKADTAVVTVDPVHIVLRGLPFGATGLLASGSNPAPLTLSNASSSPGIIVGQIASARAQHLRLLLALTGGSHTAAQLGCCLSVQNGIATFDQAKWDATLAKFNTPAIQTAIAAGVADGTILGAIVMDEPYVTGGGDGNTWGPKGTMTKVRVDGLCAAVQGMFPTLPAGVQHGFDDFEPTKSYKVCQFISGGCNGVDVVALVACRADALAIGARDHHAILFSMNVLDGGRPDTDGVLDCAGSGQAGVGSHGKLCRMTAADLRSKGMTLGPFGCGLLLWRYDSQFFGRPDNQQALAAIAESLATIPPTPCRRTA